MNNWTPLMDSIVDSSLWTEPYYVRILFVTMMALKDKDMIVRRSAFAIAQRAHMKEQEVLDGLKILAAPDRKRLEPQPFDGRRIQKVEEGWLILNGLKYRKLIGKEKRREYKAGKAREYYEQKKSGGGHGNGIVKVKQKAGEKAFVDAVEAGKTDAEAMEIANRKEAEFRQ
jgi:hypothetical protein